MLEEKIDLTEFDELIKQLEIIKSEKLSINIFDSEIKEIRQLIDNKSNSIDVINALDTKADKEELKNSIQNKIEHGTDAQSAAKDNCKYFEQQI